MMNEAKMTELSQAEDMAYFRADRATRSRLMQCHYDTEEVMKHVWWTPIRTG